VIRAYLPKPSGRVPTGLMDKTQPVGPEQGAGYEAQFVELIKAGDGWFRPSDVCVGPDGAIYIADWYDPGVGGHATGDRPPRTSELHGRIYRLAPTGFKASKPKLDLSSVKGQIEALKSPNYDTRYLAYEKLRAGGEQAASALKDLWGDKQNPRFRARALGMLARTPQGEQVVRTALKDEDVDLRVTAIRAAREIKMDIPALAKELANDPHPFVWRELAIAMRYEPDDKAVPVLVSLADKFDGKDRWYLEALGIGAEGREKEVLEAWKKDGKNKDNALVAERLTWRLTFGPPLANSPTADAAPAVQGQPGSAVASAGAVLPDAQRGAQQPAPAQQFPPQKSKDGKALASPVELSKLKGDAKAGAAVFRNQNGANCISCHQVNDEGKMLGPPLSTIGQKLSKDQLYQAILYPSSAILMGYENWLVKTKGGEVLSGLKVEDTPDHVTIKDTKLEYHDVPTGDVAKQVKQDVSVMPEGLSGTMTRQELVDLVEYLSTLRNPV
jgi:putative heme-binding domain-containing protein